MDQIEVEIRVFKDDLLLEELRTLECEVYCEYNDERRPNYDYGWDSTVIKEIESYYDRDEWSWALVTSQGEANVEEIYNFKDEDEARVVYLSRSASEYPFTPFVLMFGNEQWSTIDSTFNGKKIISKSTDDLDRAFTNLYAHPDALIEMFSEVLRGRKQECEHVDVVYEPERSSLIAMQLVRHYEHMFYFSSLEDVIMFYRSRSQLKELSQVEETLQDLIDTVDDSDKRVVKNFVKKLDGMKDKSWSNILKLSTYQVNL